MTDAAQSGARLRNKGVLVGAKMTFGWDSESRFREKKVSNTF